MTLKERILNSKPSITKEDLEIQRNSEDAKRYDDFLKICKRLQNQINLSDIYCSTYDKVFELIEEYKIEISDIVPKEKYSQYKKLMLESGAQLCPTLGKDPDKIYDFSKEEDRLEYMRINGKVQF